MKLPVVNVPVYRVVSLCPEGLERAGSVPTALLEVLHSARQPRGLHGVDGVVRGYLHVAPEMEWSIYHMNFRVASCHSLMGNYNIPARGTMEIIPSEGHIILPKRCIICILSKLSWIQSKVSS